VLHATRQLIVRAGPRGWQGVGVTGVEASFFLSP